MLIMLEIHMVVLENKKKAAKEAAFFTKRFQYVQSNREMLLR